MRAPYLKTAVAACLIMSAMIAGTVSFGFFMDPVTTDLGFDRSTFSLYFSLVTIVGTITLPVYGRVINAIGARKMVIVGGIWTGITMACFSLCTTLPLFYLVGCLVGLGFFGCSYAAVPVIVSAWFHEKQSFIMGVAGACGGAVAMVMSLVFPTVIETAGWNAGYVLLGALVFVLTTPVGIFLLRSTPEEVGLAPYGAKEDAKDADTAAASGVPYRTALKSAQLWVAVIVFVLLAVTVTLTQHLAAYFTSVGFSPIMAGVFMSIISAGIILTNSGAGIVSDRLGFMRTFVIFSVLYLVSYVVLPLTLSIPLICVALVLMSIGNANTTVFAPVATSILFGQKDYAAIWGFISMACVLGQAIGAPLWGLAYDLTGGYQIGMYVSAVLIALSTIALSWAVKRSTADDAHGGRSETAAA